MDNRSRILDCALRLFASRGYDAVGVQEIVDAAGITKPTLYHYFGSKQGLLDALLEEYFGQLNASIREAAVYSGDLSLTLAKIVTAFFHFANQHPTFYRLELALWFTPPDSTPHQAVARWNQDQYETVEGLFQQAAVDHGNMRGRHRAYAVSLIGAINSYIALGLNGYTKLDEPLIVQALHQFQYGIYS